MQRKMPMMRKEFMTGTMDRDSAVMICAPSESSMTRISVMARDSDISDGSLYQ